VQTSCSVKGYAKSPLEAKRICLAFASPYKVTMSSL
jgi:hypothetical protein